MGGGVLFGQYFRSQKNRPQNDSLGSKCRNFGILGLFVFPFSFAFMAVGGGLIIIIRVLLLQQLLLPLLLLELFITQAAGGGKLLTAPLKKRAIPGGWVGVDKLCGMDPTRQM